MKNNNTKTAFYVIIFISIISSFFCYPTSIEKKTISIDQHTYPQTHRFFLNLLEKYSTIVDGIFSVQTTEKKAVLQHYQQLLFVPVYYLPFIEQGDTITREYIESYINNEMTRHFSNISINDLIYHTLGITGVYLIITRYLQYTIPIIAIGGIGYIAHFLL